MRNMPENVSDVLEEAVWVKSNDAGNPTKVPTKLLPVC